MKCLEQSQHSNLKFKKAFFAFFLLIFFNISLFGKIIIDIQPVVKIEKDEIYIKDIATVEASENEKKLKSFIEDIFLLKIEKGIEKLEKKEILDKLKENYIDIKKIDINSPDYVILKREILKLKKSDIEKDINRFLIKKFGDEVSVKSLSLSKDRLIIPSGKIYKKIDIKSLTNSHLYVDYLIFINGKLYKKLPITIKIDRFKIAVFAKRDIPKGKKIDKNDIYFKKIKYKRVSEIVGKDEVIGKIAKRSIKKDSIIKRYLIEPDYLVLKRKNVRIIYKNGPIKIELLGLALENGSLGQIIKVKNISSNKVIKCKVVAPFTVEFIR